MSCNMYMCMSTPSTRIVETLHTERPSGRLHTHMHVPMSYAYVRIRMHKCMDACLLQRQHVSRERKVLCVVPHVAIAMQLGQQDGDLRHT